MTPEARIAIAQVRMHWTIDGNLQAIADALAVAAARGAAICAFSELAVTGFHRGIAALAAPALVGPAVDRVRALAAAAGVAAAVGAPDFDADGSRYIAHHLIGGDGRLVATVRKRGLTDPEATFFRRGTARPIGLLGGLRCTAVVCREVEDREQIARDVPPGAADIVFVPGALRQDPAKPASDPPPYVDDLRALARATAATVVQTNWPNALNRPEESLDGGGSCVVAPDGALLLRLPKQAAGVGVFALGARSFDWVAA